MGRFLAISGVVFFLLAGCNQQSSVQQDAAALVTTQARTNAVQTQAAALQQLAVSEGQATNVAIAATVAASAVPLRAAATAQAAAAAGASLATQAAIGATATVVAGQVYAKAKATAQVDRAGWRARRDAAAQYVPNCGLAAEIATRSTTAMDAISQGQKLNEATEAIKTCND